MTHHGYFQCKLANDLKRAISATYSLLINCPALMQQSISAFHTWRRHLKTTGPFFPFFDDLLANGTRMNDPFQPVELIVAAYTDFTVNAHAFTPTDPPPSVLGNIKRLYARTLWPPPPPRRMSPFQRTLYSMTCKLCTFVFRPKTPLVSLAEVAYPLRRELPSSLWGYLIIASGDLAEAVSKQQQL